MLSEYITSLADVSFHIVAYMYARFRYSGKNPMRFAVFWRISVRFCGFQTPLTPPSKYVTIYNKDLHSPSIHQSWLSHPIILRALKQQGVWTIQRFILFSYFF